MTPEEVYDNLTPIFHDVFDDDSIRLVPEMSAEDVEEWDSLNHIRLIVAVEKKLGVKFSSSEIMRLENVSQFVDLIREKAID